MKIKLIYICFLSIVIVACSGSKGDIPLAKVGNNTLYYSDLNLEMPVGISKEDSIALLKNFIQSWVMDELLAQEADDFLSKDEKDFSKQIENYEKSLLVFEFEKKWVLKHLDTLISNEEVNKYYLMNKAEFELKTSIVRLSFIKMPINQKTTIKEQAKRLLFSNNKRDKASLQKICDDYAENYFLDDSVWLVYDDITKEIPISNAINKESFSSEKKLEFSDEHFDYYVVIKEIKIKDEVSPVAFETENIKQVIIQNRKNKLLDSLYNSLYSKATSTGSYTIY